jgi:hypothetical protein
MSAYIAPIGNDQQADANGAPVSGALITTYLAGTTTLATTYTDAAGLVPQANPVVCNAAGFPALPIFIPAGVSLKMVFTTSVASGSVAYRPAVDGITGVNDPSFAATVSEWTAYSGTPTFISATSFSVAGDQTNTFQVSRRLKSTATGGTIYSSITGSIFAAGITTVTVVNSSGLLDAGLSVVTYGILASLNPSSPPPNRSYTEYTANANLSTTIPLDDTAPQNTEGTQVISVSFTPRSITSRLRLRFQGQVSSSAAPIAAIAAIFSSASASAIAADFVTVSTIDYGAPLVCEVEYVPGVTTALTFSVRVGPASAANLRMNGNSSARTFGGVSHATLVIEEIAV